MTYDIICQNYDIIGQTMISGVPRFQMTGSCTELFKRKREKTLWELKSNVTVTDASLEGKLVEMRDTFLRNLSEEGGCYKTLE